MSSGAGEAGGAGGLDLNCDTVAVLDNHEVGAEEGLEEAPVSTGSKVLERERQETTEAGGDGKKDCERGVADREDGMVGNGVESGESELGGGSEDGVVSTVRREAGVGSHGGKLLEVDFGEKGSAELVSVSTVGFEDVEASSQIMDLGDGSGGYQKRGTDVETKVVVGTDKDSLDALVGGIVGTDKDSPDVLVGGGGAQDESLEGLSSLRREQVEVGGNLGDGSSQVVDGELGTGKWVAEAKSYGGRCTEEEVREKGIAKLVGTSAELSEAVEASSQAMDLGDVSGGDQKRGADVDMEGMMGTDEVSLAVLVGGGVVVDERLEGSLILRREQVEVQVDLVDGGGELVDGQLGLEEREPEGESHAVKLLEVDTGEKEIADLFTVSAEEFEPVEASNQAMNLGSVSGDQTQGIDVDADGMVIEHLLGPGETEAEVMSHRGKFLEVEKGEEGSSQLVAVSTEGFERAEASSHAGDFHDGCGGDQKRGTDLDTELDLVEKGSEELVSVSTVEFECVEARNQALDLGDGSGDDQNRRTDANTEGMVRTDEDSLAVLVVGGGAEGKGLEGSSILREEQVEVDLVDGLVQVLDDQVGPEERNAKDESLGVKLLEMNTGERDSADLVAISAEEFEAVAVSNQAVNSGDCSGGDQKQGNDLDAESIIIDGQLGPGKMDAKFKSRSGKFLEVNKGGEGSAVLVAVSTEGFEPVEASSHSMDFRDGSDGGQKRGTDLDVEGMVIDDELDSGEREVEVESHGGRLLEMDRLEKGSPNFVSVSTERFEPAKACSQAMDLGDGSGDDQKLGTDLDAEDMVGIHEDSVAVSVVTGEKLLEVGCEERRSAKLIDVSTEVFELVKASSQAINLVDRSGDDQRLVIDVDAEGMVGINEDCVTNSVGIAGPEDERSEGSLLVEVQGDLGDGSGQFVDGELDAGKREAEFKSYGGRCVEMDKREKWSAKLVGASAELSEAVEASSLAMNLGDGYVGDEKRGADVDTEGVMGTDELSLTVLVVAGGDEDERLEGSSILRTEQLEIQIDLVDGSDLTVGGQLGCGEREAEVASHEGTPLEVHTGEKESADLIAVSAEEFEAIESSNQAINPGDGSGGDQVQGIDVDAEGMVIDGQLGPGERDAGVKSQSRKLLEADKREKGSEELVAVSNEIFEPVEASSQAVDFGDGSDGDQKRESDVNAEGIAIDAELSPGKREAEVESHGGNFFEVDRDNEGSVEMPAISTEGFGPVKASIEPMDLVNGSGGDQRLETDVDAEAMVSTDEDSVAISVASGATEDARLEGSLVLRKEHVEVQDDLVDGSGEVVEGELATAISEVEVKSYGERCMEVDIGEKGSTNLVVSSTEWSEAVEASSQAMYLGDESGSNQKHGTCVDAAGVAGNEDSLTVSVVGGASENERLDGSLTLGKEQVEDLVHLVDGCGQVENELESHGEKLLEVELEEKRKELIAVSAERFEAAEVICQAMDLGDRSGGDQTQGIDVNVEGLVDTSDGSASVSAGGGGPVDERLEESSVFGIEHVEVLRKSVDGCGQVANSELIHGERNSVVESHGGKLLKVETGAKGGAELFTISAKGFEAVEACSQVMNLEHGSGGDQKQGTDVDVEYVVVTDGDFVNVSGADGVPEDISLEGSLLLGKEQTEVPWDLMDGHDQVLDGEFGPGKRKAEVEPHCEKLLDEDSREKGSVELASVPTGGYCAVEASSQDMDFEVGYSSEQKQETNVDAACMVRTDEDSVAVSVGGGGPEDERLDTSYKFGEKQVDVGEDHTGFEAPEKKLVQPEKIGGGEVDAMRDAGHVQDPVHNKHVQDLDSREGFGGDHRSESCVETDAEPLVVAVAYQRAEAQGLEGAPRLDGVQVGVKCNCKGSQMMEKVAHSQKSGDSVNVDVSGLVEEHPDEREGEIVGDNGHNQSEVISEFSAGEENLIEMGVEAGIVHHSKVSSERVDVCTQASSVENDQKTYETVQKLDSIPITEEQDSGSQQVDGDMKNTIVSGSTVCCFDVAKTAMALDAAVNVEAWSSDEHAAVDNMLEKGNVVLEDNDSVMSVTAAELQHGDAQLNFDYRSQKIDLSPLMDSCREKEAHAAGPHSELVNLTVTPQWNEPSVACQDVQPPNALSREHVELESERGTPALESALHAVNESIDCSQNLQDGTQENVKESDNPNEGCDRSASTGQQAAYYLSFPEKEGFSTSDLVWGKVKSHPWWPGQIFDFLGASELALKYQKKDHFLVAYFGDKTFAWCEESRLKPFELFFSQMEMQTSSDSFLRAVCDILVEISRRVELSMTCLCLPEDTHVDIKYQKVENAGVKGKTVNSVFDRYEVVNYFNPDKLLEYVRALAQLPTGGADRLELTIAQAQLKGFYLSKGYTELPAFTNGSGLVENDFETPSAMSKNLNEDDLEHSATLSDLFSAKGKLRGRDGTLGKQKHILEDGRKQKSLSELMEEETTFLLVNRCENASKVQDDESCFSTGNKRKALDYVSTDIGRNKTKKIDSQSDKETKLPSPTSNSSFKVGEFISRAASKLTSGQPIRKCHGETSERCLSKTDDMSIDYMDIDDFLDVPFDYPKLQIDISGDYPPTNEMLSKLCLAARNPMKGYNFSSIVISFFSTFRNVQVSTFSFEKNKIEKPRAKRGRKKKIISDLESPDMSTPDHMKDSYWSDMILPEKDAILNPPKRRGRKKRKFIDESSPSQMLSCPSDCEPKLHTGTMCPHVKHILTTERPIISVEEKIVDERTPTAVILYFNSSNSLPSDTDLIRIFSRYGPLKEEETYIERKNNSAMVVFKKRADAEMAFSSAGKFSTFGPALLSYRLRHFPFNSSPLNTLKGEDYATQIQDGHVGILAEPEFNGASDGKLCEVVGEESSIVVQSQGHFGPVLDTPPVQFDDVNRGPSYFVQTQEDGGNAHVEIGGAEESSELAQYQVGVAVGPDSTLAKGGKEASQDVPAQMESGAVSDHLLLESLDQELSYFDLDQEEAGGVSGNMQVETVCQDSSGSVVDVSAGVISDLSGTEIRGEKSCVFLLEKAETLEVSHAANDGSLGQESFGPAPVLVKAVTGAESPIQVAVTRTSDSLADQLENETVLETTTQLEAVDQEFSCSAPAAETKDIQDEFNISPDPREKECSESPQAHVCTGASDESSVTIDVQLMEKELTDFVQDNEDVGVDSCALEVQAITDATQVELGGQCLGDSGHSK